MLITLYGIPRAIGRGIRRVLSGTLGDILWKLFVLTLVLALGYILVAAGGVFGAVIGAALIGTLINDDVRRTVSDLWNRNWAET